MDLKSMAEISSQSESIGNQMVHNIISCRLSGFHMSSVCSVRRKSLSMLDGEKWSSEEDRAFDPSYHHPTLLTPFS